MSSELIFVLIGGAVVGAIAIAVAISRRNSADGVDSFRRQIDALSPEARRGVVDQVQNVAERDADPEDDLGA